MRRGYQPQRGPAGTAAVVPSPQTGTRFGPPRGGGGDGTRSWPPAGPGPGPGGMMKLRPGRWWWHRDGQGEARSDGGAGCLPPADVKMWRPRSPWRRPARGREDARRRPSSGGPGPTRWIASVGRQESGRPNTQSCEPSAATAGIAQRDRHRRRDGERPASEVASTSGRYAGPAAASQTR